MIEVLRIPHRVGRGLGVGADHRRELAHAEQAGHPGPADVAQRALIRTPNVARTPPASVVESVSESVFEREPK